MFKFYITKNMLIAYNLIIALLLFSTIALAEDTTKPGDTRTAAFFCHTTGDMSDFGTLMDAVTAGDIDQSALMQAGFSLIMRGKCVYFPRAIDFEYVELIDNKSLNTHEIWKAKLEDGSFWYVLHKVNPT